MSVQAEFIPLLRDCIKTFDSFEFEAKQVEFHTTESHWRAMICQISLIELGSLKWSLPFQDRTFIWSY